MAPNPGDSLRVLVVDDSEAVRLKMRMLLEGESEFQLVGEAPDGATGVELARQLGPDVVVMDLKMPGISGIEATWEIGSGAPDSKVLVLTVSEDQEDLTDAILAGAGGYVVKGAPDSEVLAAMRRVGAGERVLPPEAARSVVERVRSEDDSEDAPDPVDAEAGPPAPAAAPARGGLGVSAGQVGQALAIAVLAGLLLTMVWRGEEIHDTGIDAEIGIAAAVNVFAAFVLLGIGLMVGRLPGRGA